MLCYKFMLPWQRNHHTVLNWPKNIFFKANFEQKKKQTCILTIDTNVDDQHLV